jgi:predicted nucleotidyltransferase
MTYSILEQEPKLAEIVRRLVAAYQPERIYLFGSAARGDSGPDSDYDLLVIVPDEAPPERRDGGLAYHAVPLKRNSWRLSRVVNNLPRSSAESASDGTSRSKACGAAVITRPSKWRLTPFKNRTHGW